MTRYAIVYFNRNKARDDVFVWDWEPDVGNVYTHGDYIGATELLSELQMFNAYTYPRARLIRITL